MNQLLQSGFVSCVRDYAAEHTEVTAQKLNEYYEEFETNLEKIVSDPDAVPYDSLRTLKFTLVELTLLRDEIPSTARTFHKFLKRAVVFLETEIDLMMLLIDHPSLAEAGKMPGIVSPLYWSEDFTLTDLLELLCALWKAGVLRYDNGKAASFNVIVRCFEKLFNVKFKEVRVMKSKTLNRKLKVAPFIDKLHKCYVDLTAK